MRLDVPSGTGVRFEPGLEQTVTLVADRRLAPRVRRGRARAGAARRAGREGRRARPRPRPRLPGSVRGWPGSAGRPTLRLYGPTTGDMVRLGDTSLLAEIEHDFTRLRGRADDRRRQEHARRRGLPAQRHLRLRRARHGRAERHDHRRRRRHREGRHRHPRRRASSAIGKAGNPDVMDGVDARLRCGPNTTVVHGDWLHRHRRRRRRPRAFPVAAAVRARAGRWHHHDDRDDARGRTST